MSDLTNATRELFVRTVDEHIWYPLPFYEELKRRNQITFAGGKYIEKLGVVDEMDDLAQSYTMNEALTDEAKDMLEKPSFLWKYAQIPLRYSADWEVENANAGSEEQLLDLPEFLVKQAHRAVRLKMSKFAWNSGTETPILRGDKEFESIVSALNHDTAYGGKTRTFGTANAWFQGADQTALLENIAAAGSAQDTAINISVAALRKLVWESNVAHHVESLNDIYIMMCPTLFNKLRAEMEAKFSYRPPAGDTVRQGFQKMYLDDAMQIVSVPYLQKSDVTVNWLTILNLNDWELRISKARNFKLTEFEWQGKNANGYDYYLARILWAGNLICWRPSGSMWLTAVS